jgi:hypothetical protein
VNGLISLKVEDEHVLNYTHALIFDLIEKGVVMDFEKRRAMLAGIREQDDADILLRYYPFPYNGTLPPDTKFRKRTYDPEDAQ